VIAYDIWRKHLRTADRPFTRGRCHANIEPLIAPTCAREHGVCLETICL